ncbi:MAG: imidazole glycerol phosphate synthase subunit HisH [Theionarchaea archaeon]|nr:imidazole glycerol phosphate synthase subunit HisH [Theionarchaea archaeon]
MIGIIDYGAGNLLSVKKALDFLQVKNRIIHSPQDLEGMEKILLPGVGAFQSAVQKLKEKGLFDPVKAWLETNNPFLGICLGMQILFPESEEAPGVKGFAVFPGHVARFTQYKVPQIGWNQVSLVTPSKIGKGIVDGQNFYFLHGYYVQPKNKDIIVGKTDYGVSYPSIIASSNIYGVQFHPEKSGTAGLSLLHTWVMSC